MTQMGKVRRIGQMKVGVEHAKPAKQRKRNVYWLAPVKQMMSCSTKQKVYVKLTLHPRLLFVILVHSVLRLLRGLLLPCVQIGHVNFLDYSIRGKFRRWVTRREGGLKVGDEGGVDEVGELDVELDKQVAGLVVSVGWHALSRNDLHGT
jgi:hypothetical protein